MELETAVRGRRSIRKFTSKKIPGVVIDEILDAATVVALLGEHAALGVYRATHGRAPCRIQGGRRADALGGVVLSARMSPMPESWSSH